MTEPIKLIDISAWQGARIDFAAVASDNVRGVYIKATEGASYVNPHLETHWRGVVDHGMFPGAYHFDRWLDDAEPQIAHFARAVGKVGGHRPGVLSPALDTEGYRVDPNTTPEGSRRFVSDGKGDGAWYAWYPGATQRDSARAHSLRTRAALEAMEREFDRWSVSYVGRNFFRDHFGWSDGKVRHFDQEARDLASWQLWQPDYNPPLDVMPVPWKPLMWQHTGKGRVAGIKGNVDINMFMGTEDEFRQLAGLRSLGSQSSAGE